MQLLPEAVRDRIHSARRVVVKVGTNVVMREDGALALGRLYGLIESVAGNVKEGREVLLVSSGAVGLGRQALGLPAKSKELVTKQACAAAGQGRLMAVYQEAFGRMGLVAAQVLLVEEDFSSRTRYLNLRATLNRLLELKAVPILNENDVVSTVELENPEGSPRIFGDNDKLSALVASKMEADLLVLLTDVDGLYTANPSKMHDARRLSVVEKVTPDVLAYAEGGSSRGRGGMKTKLEAAGIATRSGAITVIASGREAGVLDRVLSGEEVGTVFLPLRSLDGKRRWIAYAATVSGVVTVNDGARQAIIERKASLLPAGITEISGEWGRGDVVEIRDRWGRLFARGQVNYGSGETRKVLGMQSDEVKAVLGKKNLDALVTRNEIVVLDPEEATS